MTTSNALLTFAINAAPLPTTTDLFLSYAVNNKQPVMSSKSLTFTLTVTNQGAITAKGVFTSTAMITATNDLTAVNNVGMATFTGPWQITVDWGDGSALTHFVVNQPDVLPPQSHRYQTAGAYMVTVTVQDHNGASHAVQFMLTVSAAAEPPATVKGYLPWIQR